MDSETLSYIGELIAKIERNLDRIKDLERRVDDLDNRLWTVERA